MKSELFHIPVMVSEVVNFLRVVEGGLYVDCTIGGGGHSAAILEKGGHVIGIDRDKNAVSYVKKRLALALNDKRFYVLENKFSEISGIIGENAGKIDGVLMDLGVSSNMIDDPIRGFSYRRDGPLLMTMNSCGQTAYDIVNTFEARDLKAIFKKFGEERKAAQIARAIVKTRTANPIRTTLELAKIVEKTTGKSNSHKSNARIFQSLRIHINDEINELHKGLAGSLDILKSGGRLCVISYHSIEDRIVKNFMKTSAYPCICPPDFPECRCDRKPLLKIITKKIVKTSPDEVAKNPRARSARLRVSEKIAPF